MTLAVQFSAGLTYYSNMAINEYLDKSFALSQKIQESSSSNYHFKSLFQHSDVNLNVSSFLNFILPGSRLKTSKSKNIREYSLRAETKTKEGELRFSNTSIAWWYSVHLTVCQGRVCLSRLKGRHQSTAGN